MAEQLVTNLVELSPATTTLAGSINNSVTSLTLTSASTAKCPATGNFRLVTATGEIMLVTARSGDVLTVVRGQEGTTAASHTSGETVAVALTGGAAAEIADDRIDAQKNTASGIAALDSNNNLTGTIVIYADTTANLASYVPAAGQLVYNTQAKALYIGDGTTAAPLLFSENREIGSLRQIVLQAGGDEWFMANEADGGNVLKMYSLPIGVDTTLHAAEFGNFGTTGSFETRITMSGLGLSVNKSDGIVTGCSLTASRALKIQRGIGLSKATASYSSGATSPTLSQPIIDLGTLGQNITVNNPATTGVSKLDGQEIEFLGKTHSSTAYTITWGTDFAFGAGATAKSILDSTILAANNTNFRIRFRYDSTSGVQKWVCLALVYGY